MTVDADEAAKAADAAQKPDRWKQDLQQHILPMLPGVRGGMTVDPGQHLAAVGREPLGNPYLSMLDRMGVETEPFGDRTRRLF